MKLVFQAIPDIGIHLAIYNVNYLRLVSSSNSTACIKCPSNTITNHDQSRCICESGEFWDEVSGNCEKCPKDFYSLKGSSQCSHCPNFTISAEGSENCKSCQINEYWNGTMCKKCDDDSISNGTNCFECPTGLIKLNGNGTSCKTWLMIKSMATSLYNPLWAAVGISILVNFILSGCLIHRSTKRNDLKEMYQAESGNFETIGSVSPSKLSNRLKRGQSADSSHFAIPLTSPQVVHRQRRLKSAPPIPLVKPEPPSEANTSNVEKHNGPKNHSTSPKTVSVGPMRDQQQVKMKRIPSVRPVPPSPIRRRSLPESLDNYSHSNVDALYDFHDHHTESTSVSPSKRYSSKKDIFEGRLKTTSFVLTSENMQFPENESDLYSPNGLNERTATSKTVQSKLESNGKNKDFFQDDEETSTSQNSSANENTREELIDDDDIYATL